MDASVFSIFVIFQVIPVIMQCLPLKEDFEEIVTVYSTLFHLYGDCQAEVRVKRNSLFSMKEGSVLCSDALNTFSYGYMASEV